MCIIKYFYKNWEETFAFLSIYVPSSTSYNFSKQFSL